MRKHQALSAIYIQITILIRNLIKNVVRKSNTGEELARREKRTKDFMSREGEFKERMTTMQSDLSRALLELDESKKIVACSSTDAPTTAESTLPTVVTIEGCCQTDPPPSQKAEFVSRLLVEGKMKRHLDTCDVGIDRVSSKLLFTFGDDAASIKEVSGHLRQVHDGIRQCQLLIDPLACNAGA